MSGEASRSDRPGPGGGPAEEPTGRDRLASAVRHPSRRQVAVGVLLAVLGFAAVVQIQSTDSGDPYSGLRQEDLIQVLNGLSAAAQRAENDIAQLEQAQQSLRSNADSREAAISRAREQVDALGVLAGTLQATGPGIRVTVTDLTGQAATDQLVNAVQELRDAGAEAIELNDSVRVVAQTAFEDGSTVGRPGVVLVDGAELTAPFVIDAVGDPDTLAAGLEILGGFIEQVELADGAVTVERPEVVEVTSTRPARAPQYAEPLEDQ